MRGLLSLIAIMLLSSAALAADFLPAAYLYPAEKGAKIEYVTFQSTNNTTSATTKIVTINGEEAFLLQNEKPITEKGEIAYLLNQYYKDNFYPSQQEMAALKEDADAFYASRNYKTKYGPAEEICMSQGTFLKHRPCNDYQSCFQTASLLCAITGAEGCLMDVLANYILDYKQGVDQLDSAQQKFEGGFNLFAPATISTSLLQMEEGFSQMKTAADRVAANKLRFPEKTVCKDCIGVCPEPHFDYNAINSGKEKVAALREKTAAYADLDLTVEKIYVSTTDRIKFKSGEEKAAIFEPKFNAAKNKFSGLKAKAVEAKALVADSNFVSYADAFLNKGEQLEEKLAKREFDGFDSLLAAYESSGLALLAVVDGSTTAFKGMADQQDTVGDTLIQAQWSVNRLSSDSVQTYNSLAERKNKLDAKVTPPMTAAQYAALQAEYEALSVDSKAFLASSQPIEGSVFGVGNKISMASVDGAMSLAGSMAPISFKTRQDMAKFIPPLVLGVFDLAVLAVGILVFVGVFYYFHGFFRSKLAISGWAITMLGFVFILLVGSVGFYAIVLQTEKFTAFTDYYGTVKDSGSAAVIVEETGASQSAAAAMRSCADQIEAQLSSMGKSTQKFYINGKSCTVVVPMAAANGTNSSNVTYQTVSGLSSDTCLDDMPDVPFFDLQYSQVNQPPVFTVVVSKQALFRGNEQYYGKAPLCDPANVLS